MELRWTPWPDLTNTRLLSPGIIWFWSQANIPWLDFVIDSARAVKVSQSPGSRARAGACTRWPSVGIWHTKQCRFQRRNQRTHFRNWCLDIYYFPNHFWNDGASLHVLHFTLHVGAVASRALWRQTKQYKADTSRWSGHRCSWRLVCQEWLIFLDRFQGGVWRSV